MKKTLKSAISAAILVASTSVGAAEEVNLKSKDGVINLHGELSGFVDNVYIISTFMGEMRINGEEVDCFGDACPGSSDVTIAKETPEVEAPEATVVAQIDETENSDITSAEFTAEVSDLTWKVAANEIGIPEPEPAVAVSTKQEPQKPLSDKITVRSKTGSVELSGTYLEFKDNVFLLDTVLGKIRIPADGMECLGDMCP